MICGQFAMIARTGKSVSRLIFAKPQGKSKIRPQMKRIKEHKRGETMHRFIRNILRFIIRHKRINQTFSQWKWFNHLCYEEAQAVIGNRAWK